MKRLNWIAAILMAVLLLLGSYVGAYFALSDYVYSDSWPYPGDQPIAVRHFDNQLMATVFVPMLKVESMVRGLNITGVYAEQSSTQI